VEVASSSVEICFLLPRRSSPAPCFMHKRHCASSSGA
jgi:hypothetical protein